MIAPLTAFTLVVLAIFAVFLVTLKPPKNGLFGPLKDDFRAQRLLRIGLGLGLMLGTGFPDNWWEAFWFGFGAFFVILTSLSQKRWPDRAPDNSLEGER